MLVPAKEPGNTSHIETPLPVAGNGGGLCRFEDADCADNGVIHDRKAGFSPNPESRILNPKSCFSFLASWRR
jgi:hypothetical protein